MRRFSSYIFLTLFIALLTLPERSVFAASENILLSEVQITGGTGHTDDDFVELYNPTNSPIDISNFRLRYKNSKGTEGSMRVFSSGSCVPAQGFFLWANSKGVFASLADTTTSTTLSNDYSVLLYPQEGTTPLDTVSFGAGTTLPNPGVNQSLSRDPTLLTWSVTATPTPTKSTPCPAPEPTPPPIPTATNVRLNELLPNPSGEESAGEFIELYNDADTEANIGGFILHDASQTGSYTLPKDTLIPGRGYLVIPGNASKIALNNSNETLSLFDPANILVDSVHYQTTKENVSLNFSNGTWRGGTPTPGALNQINILPETKERIPKKGYRGMSVLFDARGRDTDGGTLKYTWDFGDGHKSYKEETSHIYEENGTYQVTLTTSDDKDDIVETFSIKIESFPKFDVRITSLIPNPSGKDSDNEWLLIENREKESLNLENFSIATGWDNLINHPIRKSFVIKPKSTVKLTRDFSLFTLPNKKGRIELRTPSGKVLQEIAYKEEKSIAEDAVYYKEKGKRWAWKKKIEEITTPPTNEEKISEAEIIPQAESEEPLPSPENTPLLEEKSTNPQAANVQTLNQEALRRKFYQSLHHHEWVNVSNTPLSFQSSSNNFKNLLLKANALLNDWQNGK